MKRQAPSLGSEWSILGHLLAIVMVCGVFSLGLWWLMKPTVLANPSLAAYMPPPATHLIPPARKMDAPDIALEPSPFTTLARDYDPPPEIQPQQRVSAPVRKRPKARENPEQTFARGWNDQGNDGYRRWGDRQDSRRERYSREWNRGGGSWFW
jgi:hypothetical protein